MFIKKLIFSLFPDDFFPINFGYPIRVFFDNFFLAFFPPIFWSRFYKKNVFSHIFQTMFFHRCLLANAVCFWKKIFPRFSPIFCHNIHVFIKNLFSHFFQTIFFHRLKLAIYVCFRKKFYSRFFPLFLVTIFVFS